MKLEIEDKIAIIVLGIVILIFTTLIFVISMDKNASVKTLQNGCTCGGEWEYQQAVGHSYSTSYIYKCNKCGIIEEFVTKPSMLKKEKEEN